MNQINIRPIQEKDNEQVCELVKSVLSEFVNSTDGYASSDAELDDMFTAYNQPASEYFVLVNKDQEVVGVGGLAGLEGCETGSVAELRKMYLKPSLRGQGLGELLIVKCIEKAREFGYQSIYLETLPHMYAAQKLYERHGFEYLTERLGNTGHHGCPVFMSLDLNGKKHES